MKLIIFKIFVIFLFYNNIAYSQNLMVYSLGYFDVLKSATPLFWEDGYGRAFSEDNDAIDFRIESRLDKTIFDVGPDNVSLYEIKPFFGLEFTDDEAYYALTGIYIEEKIGKKFFITPSFGGGYYDEGEGKKMGGNLQFRTTIELSREMKNNNRLGISLGHI